MRFTVAAGGTIAVGANVQVLLNSQTTLATRERDVLHR